MSKKVLLREYYELCEGGVCQDLLTEEEKRLVANGTTILSGVMQKADALNGNGRVYPRRVLEKEMRNYQKLVNERRALGELDHPDDSVVITAGIPFGNAGSTNLLRIAKVIADKDLT